MKKIFNLLIWGLLIILLIISAGTSLFFYLQYQKLAQSLKKQLPTCEQPATETNIIALPEEITKNWQIAKVQDVSFNGLTEKYLVFHFQEKSQDFPQSYLAIYKQSSDGLELVYQFLPVLPEEMQANPLVLDKILPIYEEPLKNQTTPPKTLVLLTTWSRIGASFFGSQPVVIALKDGIFQAAPFYGEDVADDLKIKNSTWTEKDFFLTNSYNPAETVKTILTQGVEVDKQNIVLSFYSDSNCRACDHRTVKLSFPWPPKL